MRWLVRDKSQAPRLMPAGALLLVLAISILVATILLGLVWLASSRQLLLRDDASRVAVRRNLQSGLAYLQGGRAVPYYRVVRLDLFGHGDDSVQLQKKPWGLFDIALVRADKGRYHDTLMALLGASPEYIHQAALYLPDGNTPLSIGGGQVIGRSYLPSAGVRPAIGIALTNPTPTTLVQGEVLVSERQLPLPADSLVAALQAWVPEKLASWLPGASPVSEGIRSTSRSFARLPVVLARTEAIQLRQITLSGNVVVASSQRLVVEPTASLDNVVLIAPVVEVKPGFHGRVQVFASDTALIGANCQLAYPSAVCATAQQHPVRIIIGEQTTIQGVILAASIQAGLRDASVIMTPTTTFEGQLYTSGVLENCGQVRGMVMAQQLLFRTPATFFNNYLINAVIDRSALSPHFISTALLNAKAPVRVAAWLR